MPATVAATDDAEAVASASAFTTPPAQVNERIPRMAGHWLLRIIPSQSNMLVVMRMVMVMLTEAGGNQLMSLLCQKRRKTICQLLIRTAGWMKTSKSFAREKQIDSVGTPSNAKSNLEIYDGFRTDKNNSPQKHKNSFHKHSRRVFFSLSSFFVVP